MSESPETIAADAEHPTSSLAWIAMALVLFPALARTLVVHSPFPWWDSDPSASVPPETAITPSGVLLLNILMLVGASLAAVTTRSKILGATVLLLLGSAGVLIHASNDLEHLVVAGSWVSGLGGLLAAAWLGQDGRVRRVMLGVGLGVVAMYFARSAVQVWIDHPMVMMDYEAKRESILAARGWPEGSPQALMFERRMSQPVATGWFGLSNVLATFAAASAVFGLSRLIFSLKIDLRRPSIYAAILAAIGIGLLILTGSKGGWGAMGIGVLAAGLYYFLDRPTPLRRVIMWLPVLAALSVLLMLAIRAMVGEGLGELSLLFRTQYIEAAMRIFGSEPLLGVGPAGFQDAYLLAKNPLNPEEVSSPHSLWFDWLATLGLFSVPWVLLLLSRTVVHRPTTETTVADRPDEAKVEPSDRPDPVSMRMVAILPISLFAFSAWFERELLCPRI